MRGTFRGAPTDGAGLGVGEAGKIAEVEVEAIEPLGCRTGSDERKEYEEEKMDVFYDEEKIAV